MIPSPIWKSYLQERYVCYVDDYKRYLKLRGFGEHINDWAFARRAFLECWLAPGFHRFWQVWNPGIGYFTYRLYRYLGGNAHRNLGTLLVFLINGLAHNIVFNIFAGRWCDFPLPFTFLAFGLFTVASRCLEKATRMGRWPIILHLVINAGLVIVSFKFGFTINDLLDL